MPDFPSLTISANAILDDLPMAVFATDADGVITYYNAAAVEFWGGVPDETARWSGAWRLYTAEGVPLAPEDSPQAVAVRTGTAVRGVEAIAERRDGTRIRFLAHPTPIRDDGKVTGAITLIVDITELRRAETDSQRLAAIVASSDDAIISKTLDGRITFWNRAACRIFGYEEDEMIGQNILKLIPPELHHEERHVLARLRAGERIDHYDTVRMRKDGRRIDVSLTVSPMRDKTGKVVGASKVARDITERKQEEKAQLLLMGELSHRVKNTLATVQAIATQSLRRSRNPGEFVAGFTGRIQSLAKAHQMLSESRWEGVELGSLVSDQVLLGIGDERVRTAGPRLGLEPQPALHLAMVLHELGTNARKYGALSTSHGNLSIEWRVTGTAEKRELNLRWKESGGPPVTAPTERGLGMILIEESLAAHGGVVTVEYGPDGLSCMLRLPLPSVKEPAGAYTLPRLPLSIQDQANRLRLHGKRILVVEDEPVIALEMAATLRDGGCEVVGPASDVAGGLELLASGEPFDAALLDANLSGEPVDELAAALTRAGVPFAFVTGYGADSLPTAFRHAPVISKPFGKNEVFSALAMLLQRRTEANLYQFDSSGRR